MGLFGKKKAMAADLATMQADVAGLQARLVEAEQARDRSDRQVGALQARVAAVNDTAADRTDVDRRFSEIGRRVECLTTIGRAVDELCTRLADERRAREHEQAALAQRIDRLPDLRPCVDGLGRRLDELVDHRPAQQQLAARVGTLDAAVARAARELGERITELGRDVDALAGLPSVGAGGAAFDELRSGQARLAQEQSRFQIAVRQDVATLAEQVRRATVR